jgi:hypothetical protein
VERRLNSRREGGSRLKSGKKLWSKKRAARLRDFLLNGELPNFELYLVASPVSDLILVN